MFRRVNLILLFLCSISISLLSASTWRHGRTYYIQSIEELHSLYQHEVAMHPDHHCMCTGQPEEFLAYELIARAVAQRFSPGYLSKTQMREQTVLRYPSSKAPRNLKKLFLEFPMVEDYDTATSVSDYLISCSPSLDQTESDESAVAIFMNGQRGELFPDLVKEIFYEEDVPPELFEKAIESLINESPFSNKKGILTQIFFPKGSDLYKFAYVSAEYGIPVGDPHDKKELKRFFKQYKQGLWPESSIPQLRLLSSAFQNTSEFPAGEIHSVRYTLVNEEVLETYAQKVDRVINEIWEAWQLTPSSEGRRLDLKGLNAKYLEKSRAQGSTVVRQQEEERFLDPSTDILEQFVIDRYLGKGAFGVVHACRVSADRMVAVKTVDLLLHDSRRLLRAESLVMAALSEFEIGVQLHHPNIMRMHHLVFKGPPEEVKAHYIMDVAEGAQYDPEHPYTAAERTVLVRQALDALIYAVEQNIIPCDLHQNNAIISNSPLKITLIDFGTWGKFDSNSRDMGLIYECWISINELLVPLSQGMKNKEFKAMQYQWGKWWDEARRQLPNRSQNEYREALLKYLTDLSSVI